ncbi:MAG: DUF2851 family protein [Chloroflexota bacterium]|nr:DUF2851 family protein [Chloroflexota bacterium]
MNGVVLNGEGRRPASEAELVAAWLRQATRRGPWRDNAGRSVAVIYPGRWTGLPGPDLRDAIVSIDGGPARRLDLEVHLDAADWRRHGHHRDPAYAGVGLHLVWEADARGPHSGPPQLALAQALAASVAPLVAGALPDSALLPCARPTPLDAETRRVIVQAIEDQGRLRHAEQAAVMEGQIAALGPDQALHQAILRALGYRPNAAAFEALGGWVTSALSEALASNGEVAGVGALEAVLMGAAGLLPMQRPGAPADGYARTLQRIWQSYGSLAGLRAADWTLQSVRPANRPTRRIAAAARLLSRAPHPGSTLAETVLAEVRRAAAASDPRRLQARFQVAEVPDAYWARHYDFGRATRRPAPTLVGADRAREILVNAVLPFAAAMGHVRGQSDLPRASAAVLAALPGGMWNHDSRYMAQTLGIERRGLGGAKAQQGLLRLHRRWCRDKRCAACPMARCAGALDADRAAVSEAERAGATALHQAGVA